LQEIILRNNKYAISTRVEEQTSGDHIASKAKAFGIKTIRVDGNDALASYRATQMARKYIIEHGQPVFIEYMTYRIGDHSTSDHSALYRNQEEIDFYKEKNNPKLRLSKMTCDLTKNRTIITWQQNS
jgi:2-oxoisovalerate dehydrogenase E1 component alpha subunit